MAPETWRFTVAEQMNHNENTSELNFPRQEENRRERSRRGVSVFTLLAGIATLFVSVYVLSDGADWFPRFDVRWMLAGGAVLIGLLMLGSSFRGDRR